MASARVDPDPFAHFADFVAREKLKHVGRDIAGNVKHYIPLCALREYWTPRRIAKVLQAFQPRLEVDIPLIRRRFLRVFSILVYLSGDAVCNLSKQFISRDLCDDKLPQRSRPAEWADTKFHNDLFHQIRDRQWLFFPLCFAGDQLQDRELGEEYVLPIDPPEEIERGDAAVVQHLVIHDSYNHLSKKVSRRPPHERCSDFKIRLHPLVGCYWWAADRADLRLQDVPQRQVRIVLRKRNECAEAAL